MITTVAPGTTLAELSAQLQHGGERALADDGTAYLVVYPWSETDGAGIDTQILSEEPLDGHATEACGIDPLQRTLPAAAAPRPTQVDPRAWVLPVGKTERNPFAGLITVGRARNNDLRLEAPSVSKLHAWFSLDGEQWRLRDQGSTNGTQLDGTTIGAHTERAVTPGDALTFGTVHTLFTNGQGLLALCRPSTR